jgi:UDP-galactopyranose mutase
MGYNPKFIYPKDGGIDCLPRALAEPIERVYMGESVEYIDTKKKYVRLASGHEERYDFLISTLPIPGLYRLIGEAPDRWRDAARKLNAISVLNINIGINRPNIHDQHWIYFPENEFIFSRIGFPMNFSRAVAPEGTSSMYIEITHPMNEKPNVEEAFERSLRDLQKCGILQKSDSILTRHVLDIRCAYVVFDEHRQKFIGPLTEYLESLDIYTAGRYGRWDYYSMEDSILSGKASAEQVAKTLKPVTVGM